MAGLRNICKLYGRMKISGVMWLWDYVNDQPVKESEMPEGSERWKESERVRWTAIKKRLDDERRDAFIQ